MRRNVPSGLTKYGGLNTTNEEGWGGEIRKDTYRGYILGLSSH